MWTTEMFNTDKPIIAMLHLLPLPGDPYYDQEGGMQKVIKRARADLLSLQNGNIDGILISNEFSLPYEKKVGTQVIASMARVIGELKSDLSVPFGVDVLWDPFKVFDLAVAVDAQFVREVFTGTYASDLGLWDLDYGEVVRHRKAIGAMDIKAFFNIVPEAAVYLSDRSITSIARSTVFNCKPDALCVSGLTAGRSTDAQILSSVKSIVPDTVVFANTGVKLENVEEQLSIADGAIIGTTFKRDGYFYNEVDQGRVKRFMKHVKQIRSNE